MRAHGISDFPDPEPSGRIKAPPSGTHSPAFQEAGRACAKYADETEPSEMSAEGLAEAADAHLAFSRCMRAHGVEMSDPIIGQNRMVVRLPAGMSPDDPRVTKAREQCQPELEHVLDVVGHFPGDPGTAAKH
jgi:hypothetical protein